MIQYYGHHYFKQYIKGKPIRFGYKMWALCGNNGYCYNFDLLCGKEVVDAASTMVLTKEPLGTLVASHGSHDFYFNVKNKITAVKWNDNKCVTLATNFGIIEPLTSVSRREERKAEKNKIDQPCLVSNYNKNMGGVDSHDWLLDKHTIKMCGKNGIGQLLPEFVDMAVVNYLR
ncbi:chimeric ERCC6-PGBD3 protein [Trichonephila clavipes]|nr:chimeric ERCC6-PGBD3 protein [Trichonephila clavipes]